MKYNAHRSLSKAVFETLEGRAYMSASITLVNGVLTVQADPASAGSIVKAEFSADHSEIQAFATNQQINFPTSEVTSLVLIGSTSGNDYMYVDPRLGLNAEIKPGGGNDTIWGGTGLDTIDAGSGNDLIYAHGLIYTGSGNDTVWSSDQNDTIYGGSGNELLIGGGGDNVIYGGSGNDTLISGYGTDKIVAGSGDTVIYGSNGPDTLVGGAGHDTIYGGAGANVIQVVSPNTTVYPLKNNKVEYAYASTINSPPPPVAVINQLETTITAGEGVNVDALQSQLGAGTALTDKYQWNFDDPTGKYNTLPGWSAGHVYDTPGVYSITLTITDTAGDTSVATANVTVTASTRKVVYVSTNGSDSNTGLSPAQAVKSPALAVQLAGSNSEIDFERGDTFVLTNTLMLNGHDITVGAYGTGANPIIMWEPTGADIVDFYICQNSSNITVQDLTFDSPNGVTSGPAPEITDTAVWAWGTNVVVRDNTFLNVDTAVDGSMHPEGVIVQDNTAPLVKGLRGYFCWVDGSEWTILGNTVANSTRQHVIRGNDIATVGVLIYDNNLTKQYFADDPDETQKTTINFRAGNYIYVSDNTLNDSTMSFALGPDMPTSSDINWIVVEDNTFNNAQLELDDTAHDVMIRDNSFNLSGTAEIDLLPGDLTDPDGHITDVTITDNTGVNMGTTGQFLELYSQGAPGSITVTNNLYIAPNEKIGTDYNAPVYVLASDLSAFAQISGNIWPASSTGAQGPVNYLLGAASPTHFLTTTQWDSESNVNGDQFANETLPTGVYDITLNGVTAGATGLALAA